LTDSEKLNASIAETVKDSDGGTSTWLLISIGVTLVVFALLALIYMSQRRKQGQVRVASENKEVDMSNVINSMFMAKALYDKLARAVHPDRFPDGDERTEIANQLFQLISKNKSNYEELKRLKETAEKELNITIEV
jgi:hypothetical protein